MSTVYDTYERLKFDWPADRVLRVTMENPGRLNSADSIMHAELVQVWRDIDADPNVSAVIIRGSDGAFSSGGDLDLVEEMSEDFDTLTRVWKEARDLVYNIINCSKPMRSEEHTSELQSRPHLVCRLLLEKKKTISTSTY